MPVPRHAHCRCPGHLPGPGQHGVRGWCRRACVTCGSVSNFVYFYTFNGLKQLALRVRNTKVLSTSANLLLASIAGIMCVPRRAAAHVTPAATCWSQHPCGWPTPASDCSSAPTPAMSWDMNAAVTLHAAQAKANSFTAVLKQIYAKGMSMSWRRHK